MQSLHPLRIALPLLLAAPLGARAQDEAPIAPPEEPEPAPLVDPTRPDALIRPLLAREAPGPPGVGRGPVTTPVLRGLVAPAGGPTLAAIAAGPRLVRVAVGEAFADPAEPEHAFTVAGLSEDGVLLEERRTGARVAVALEALLALSRVVSDRAAPAVEGDPGAARLARVDLRAIELAEACRLISDATGLKIVTSDGSGPLPVSLYLRDVPALELVETLCEAHGLWFHRDDASGIVRVRTAEEYERRLTTIQEERTEVFTLLYPNVYDVGNAIQNLFGERVVLNVNQRELELLTDLTDRLARFDLFDSRTQGFSSLLGGGFGGGFLGGGFGGGFGGGLGGGLLGGGLGGGLIGGGFGGLGGFGNNAFGLGGLGARAVDTAPPELERELSAEEIMRLERLLGRQEEDRAAEAEVSDVIGGVYRAPIHVTMSRRQNKLLVRTSDEPALAEIRELVRRLDVPTALVLLELRILAVELEEGRNSFFEYQWADGNFQGQFATGAIAGPEAPALGVGGTGVRPNDLVFQFVDSAFAMRIQALEREQRVRAVATPVLLTANNEVSRLFVGREVPLNRTFSGGQTIANQTSTATVAGSTAIEFRPVGTTIFVTPSINADRTVTLRIVQEFSNADQTADILVPSQEGFDTATVNVISSQTVSGTIVAQSDLAVAFGGLIETVVQDQEERVPFLGELPLLGTLFKRTVQEEQRRELVVVVRPHVLATPAESEAASVRLLDNLGIDPAPFDLHGLDEPGGAPYELFGIGAR